MLSDSITMSSHTTHKYKYMYVISYPSVVNIEQLLNMLHKGRKWILTNRTQYCLVCPNWVDLTCLWWCQLVEAKTTGWSCLLLLLLWPVSELVRRQRLPKRAKKEPQAKTGQKAARGNWACWTMLQVTTVVPKPWERHCIFLLYAGKMMWLKSFLKQLSLGPSKWKQFSNSWR